MNSYKVIKYIALALSLLGVLFVMMIQMMDLFLRRERRPKPKQISELEKKISKDRANLVGLGEEE